MIEVYIRGGLGNQMFEYAAARNYQLRVGGKLALNISAFPKDKFGRNYGLKYLNIEPDLITNKQVDGITIILDAISRYFPNFARNLGMIVNRFIWNGKNFYDISKINKKNIGLYSYFQSEKYFHEYREIIKKELKVNERYILQSELLNVIKKSNSICVHIRRGDYVTGQLIICTLDYYKKGMKIISEKVENPEFFVFSDDIEWVKKNLDVEDVNHIIHYIDSVENDYEELQLMYNCKHFIISNSSFSWWAQYLADNENKIVIAPSKWMPNDKKRRAIYMENWLLLNVE